MKVLWWVSYDHLKGHNAAISMDDWGDIKNHSSSHDNVNCECVNNITIQS